MLLGRVSKQPNETRRYLLDFGKRRLGSGEYLISVSPTVTPDTLPPITATVTLIQATVGDPTSVTCIYLYVGGGLDDTTYKITLTTVPDDTGIVWEDEIEVIVEDV